MCVPCGGKGICPHERRRWACRICCPDGRSHLSCTWLNQHLSHIAGKFARCAHALMQYVFTPADRCTPARSRARAHTRTHTHTRYTHASTNKHINAQHFASMVRASPDAQSARTAAEKCVSTSAAGSTPLAVNLEACERAMAVVVLLGFRV